MRMCECVLFCSPPTTRVHHPSQERMAYDDARVAQAEAKAAAESQARDLAEKGWEFERQRQLVGSGAKLLCYYGRLGASCGASQQALTRPQHDSSRAFHHLARRRASPTITGRRRCTRRVPKSGACQAYTGHPSNTGTKHGRATISMGALKSNMGAA